MCTNLSTKNEYSIKIDSLKNTRHLVETEHYSKSVNGIKISFVFSLWFKDEMIGCVMYGQMATTAWKKFGSKETDVLELRRLVVKRGYDKNISSWFVSKTIKYLKKNTCTKVIVSYADPFHNHKGYIYQALNFMYIGLSGKDKAYMDNETGKVYHSRALRTKYKGEFKPFVQRLRDKLSLGLLTEVVLPGKHTYVYVLGKCSSLINLSLPYPK